MPNSDANTTKKFRIPRYLLSLVLMLLFGALATVITMNWLYGALVEYEAKTPNTALNRYFDRIASRDFAVIREESDFETTPQNDWEDFDAAVLSVFGTAKPGELTYRRIASNDPDGRRVYIIYKGDARIGEVYLYEGQGEDGGWRITTPLKFLSPYTITAPSHATVLVNGAALATEDAVSIQPVEPELFSELPGSVTPPAVLTYRVEGLLAEPELSASGPEGTECALTFDDDTNTLEVLLLSTGERWDERATRIEAVAKAYARYISRDGTMATLGTYILPGTDFYTRMWHFDNQWYGTHQAHDFKDIVVSDILSTSENTFTGQIDFIFTVTQGADVFEYPSSYTMSFVLWNSQWMLLDLQVN